MRFLSVPLDYLQGRIETIMNSDGEGTSLIERILRGVSFAYGKTLVLREKLYQSGISTVNRLPCVVISVGNLTAGGTGKTPFAVYLARLLKDWGVEACLISRGYKGLLEKEGGVVSNGREILMDAEKSGDEPYLMASLLEDVPVVIGKDRYQAGLAAIREFNSDVIILDDGFQHLKLYRDFDIVLLDAEKPFGNRFCIPRGTLREPMKALSRGDAFVFTRSDTVRKEVIEEHIDVLNIISDETPVFKARHVPYVRKVSDGNSLRRDLIGLDYFKDTSFLCNLEVIAFSGIAKNNAFRKTLAGFGVNVIRFFEFGDHHNYSNEELNTILSFAKEKNVLYVMTTDKDFVKIEKKIRWPLTVFVVGVRISMGSDEARFHSFIKERVRLKL